MKKIIVSALVLLSLFACGESPKYNEACGDLVEFEIDEEYCQKYGLREEAFMLKYPESLEVDTQEDYPSKNYASFFKYDKDTLIVESVNIGYFYGLKESGKDGIGSFFGLTKESLLTSIVDQYRAQGLDIQETTMQDETIRGEKHYTVRGSINTDMEEIGLAGNYLIQMVMIIVMISRIQTLNSCKIHENRILLHFISQLLYFCQKILDFPILVFTRQGM